MLLLLWTFWGKSNHNCFFRFQYVFGTSKTHLWNRCISWKILCIFLTQYYISIHLFSPNWKLDQTKSNMICTFHKYIVIYLFFLHFSSSILKTRRRDQKIISGFTLSKWDGCNILARIRMLQGIFFFFVMILYWYYKLKEMSST